ncbi:hypothetical protein SODALDRAFT_57261 [Sodiomyces alkalinus F11]|uniref:Uncharacterized protein n=1 Tax=Sodiomyces alkalinus (strain CBS 110278 / VKM F-3762 / F11) TaxID=1314773 RepID=A0A3N2PNQ6_SODAK|nr:hypothetical protein SODALDRAFT_57261 [Sodiomyces alkalinus F11]ROT36064.1 hypothetical protein SODALDRAFT_57261 [Sodiomyces alkalinus F11]
MQSHCQESTMMLHAYDFFQPFSPTTRLVPVSIYRSSFSCPPHNDIRCSLSYIVSLFVQVLCPCLPATCTYTALVRRQWKSFHSLFRHIPTIYQQHQRV